MTQSSYPVGCRRPAVRARFWKGRSGNSGGGPGPKSLVKDDFEAALRRALKAEEEGLRQAKPATMLECVARQFARQAVKGRPSLQRLVLSILGREEAGAARGQAEEVGENAPVRFAEAEDDRPMFGDLDKEFMERFEADLAAAGASAEGLVKIVEGFGGAPEFPQ